MDQKMTLFTKRLVSKFALAVALVNQAPAEEVKKEPLSIADCVRTRRIVEGEVHISPDGESVAYVVKSPVLTENRNNYQLYVRKLHQLGGREGKVLLTADRISRIQWLDAKHIVAQVEKIQGQDRGVSCVIIDEDSGAQDDLGLPPAIAEYSISADGRTVVFSTRSPLDPTAAAASQEERERRGYRVAFGGGGTGLTETSEECEIFLGRRTNAGPITFTKVQFQLAGETSRRVSLRNISGLKLSPNGRYLLFRYTMDNLPPSWDGHPLIRQLKSFGTAAFSYALAIYEIDTRRLRIDFEYPSFEMDAVWADDSKAYAVAAPSPFETKGNQKETAAALKFGDTLRYLRRFSHVFAIDARTGAVRKVLHRDGKIPNDARYWRDLPLAWNTSYGEMLVRVDDRQIYRVTFQSGEWRKTGEFALTEEGQFASSLTSDGQVVIGIAQAPMIAPRLFLLNLATNERIVLDDLNPAFAHISLGEVERVEWTNRYGSKCRGQLIKPVGYKVGRRYPLIFMAATNGDGFIADANYSTAFAPQSLANAGFLVLMSAYPFGNGIAKHSFPGQMGMAYDWMSMVESAVDLLVSRGMTDKNDVGIVGFSRTSWLTDFTLTHSKYRFKAASSADSGIYTYGGYFEYNHAGQMKGYEEQLGGPPYGKTLANWLKYTTPFNAEHIHTPILMEYTGDIRSALEFFTALNRLGKQVELYHYPKGGHPLDTPIERFMSLQRNVDWFRFWMQGYERSDSEDPEQYHRWRALRARVQSREASRRDGVRVTASRSGGGTAAP
jgi:dipeptidyl aminopeptidase/acylaminoacyl peptidase